MSQMDEISSIASQQYLHYIQSLMAVDYLETQGARASAAMVLTYFSQKFPIPMLCLSCLQVTD